MNINHLLTKREQIAAELAAHDAIIEGARKQERAEAIAKIHALMAEMGLTVADFESTSKAKTVKAARKAGPAASGVTYAFPDGVSYTTGKQGKPPAAYTRAKLEGTLEQFRKAA